MNFKKICSIALAVSILGTSSAMLPVNAQETNNGYFGDVNHDDFINAYDITKLQDYVLEPESVNNDVLSVGDINHDGKIDNSDVSDFVDAFIAVEGSRGDVNKDDTLSVDDVTFVQMHLARYNLTEFDFNDIHNVLNLDANANGCIDVNDVTEIQKELVGLNNSDFPTESVKATDKECRTKYADYIKQYNLSDMLKGYYVVGTNSSSDLIFRDEKWEYFYNPRNDTVGLCDYLGNNKTEVLPVKLTTGRAIIEIGSYSSFSPLSFGVYTEEDDAPHSNLENIFIPSNYKLMRASFRGNEKIKNVFFESDNGYAHEWSVFADCSSLERVVLPKVMTNIPFNMFSNCESMEKVVLPNKLQTVEESVFYGTSITDIVVPQSVKTIKEEAFASAKLKNIYVMNKSADIDIKWVTYSYDNWPNLTVHGYRNSTLHDWWKLIVDAGADPKIEFLN